MGTPKVTKKRDTNMYNYANLSDTEFEALCKDIMEIKLGKTLRVFTKGRDGGIDICDSPTNPTIVIQVKHYVNSPFSLLRNSIKNEIKKLEAIKPEQYYVCTSKGLTPDNVAELFKLLSEYMQSDSNILGKNDIDDCLDNKKYQDLLIRHYKLGFSLITLNNLMHRDAKIDNEVLFRDILNNEKFFVPTETFFKVRDLINKHRAVILTGKPGSGKTMISQMLVLEMHKRGYRTIWLSNHNIRETMSLLSLDKNEKEFILLDDCFGQRYFELKSSNGSELMSLIKYVCSHENKALLMNSRITIYKEALERYCDFKEGVFNDEVVEERIDFIDVTEEEKAQIFYNHLYFNEVPKAYLDEIKRNRNYRKIINHRNYMPRVIKRMTMKRVINEHNPVEYVNYAFKLLNNPSLIWEHEYMTCVDQVDRYFVNILYSLSNGIVSAEIHRRAYYSRIKNELTDTSVDVWNAAKRRLNGNMVTIIEKEGEEYLSVADPSVNDYLDRYFEENSLEKDKILECATEYIQIERLDSEYFIEKVKDLTSIKLYYANETIKNYVILNSMVENKLVLLGYDEIAKNYFENPKIDGFDKNFLSTLKLYLELLKSPYDQLYSSRKMVNDESIESLLEDEILENYPKIFEMIEQYESNWIYMEYRETFEKCILSALIDCIYSAEVEEYYLDSPFDVISEYTSQDEDHWCVDYEAAAEKELPIIEENLTDYLYEILSELPNPFNKIGDVESLIEEYSNISIYEIVSYLERVTESDIDDDYLYEKYKDTRYLGSDAVDRLFR